MKKVTILTAIFSLLFSACTGAAGYRELRWTEISGGKHFSKPLRGARVINSEKEYGAFLMAKAIIINDAVRSFDFEKNSLLLVYSGAEYGEGFGLDIKSIGEEDGVIKVRAALVKGGQPVHYIAIPKTDKKAELETK